MIKAKKSTEKPSSVAPRVKRVALETTPAASNLEQTPAAVPVPPAPALVFPAFPFGNIKQQQTKMNKAKAAAIALRKELWPAVTDDQLWLLDNKTKVGFTQIPRTIPLLMTIINDAAKRLTQKSVPAGKTYLVLWCRVFGEAILKVDSEATFAYEAGYEGERNVTTWREHIRILKQLGFLDYQEGAAGPMQYILLFNPYAVVKKLNDEGRISRKQYVAFFQRTTDIGAGKELGA